MVGPEEQRARIIQRVEQLYHWLAREIDRNSESAGSCAACGKCCDFEAYDHRLYVTTPELIYLAANIPEGRLEPMTTGRCPYNLAGKCTVHEHRFTGCRIFCCTGDADFQSHLTEQTLDKLKAVCTEFNISYRYLDLRIAFGSQQIELP